MNRKKFPMQINKQILFKNYEDDIKFITEKRNTHIDFCEGEDNYGKYVLPVIKYNIFDNCEDIYHGFSTRLGGVSEEHLYSLNLSFSRGDDREKVMCNHKRFANAIGYDVESLVFSDQIHETIIKNVDDSDKGKGIITENDIKGVDGLVTNVPGVTLITFYADCVPNFFYDPVNKVVGVAHSGWRGTVKGIGTKMIEKMVMDYGSKPSDIICAIGPSICKACYEVSEDVALEFKHYYNSEEYDNMIVDKGDGKYMLNLHEACRYNLLKAGVTNEHIAMPDLCTCCNPEFIYSHRASKGMRGNLAAVIGLKNKLVVC